MKQNKQAADKPTAQSSLAAALQKNRGKSHCGRDCKFYITGSEFDHVEDAELIASMVQNGAQFGTQLDD